MIKFLKKAIKIKRACWELFNDTFWPKPNIKISVNRKLFHLAMRRGPTSYYRFKKYWKSNETRTIYKQKFVYKD